MKKIIYTCLFGKYDLYEPKMKTYDWKYICFTDQNIKSNNWEIIRIDTNDQRKKSREIKINSHKFLDYDMCLYIDCKFKPKVDLNIFSENLKSDLCLMRHNKRNCIYDEGLFCIQKGKDSKDIILKQLQYYRENGMPQHFGLYAPGIMLKRNTKEVNNFMELWYDQVQQFSYRDIISFSYILWKNPIKINTLPFKETYGIFK